MFVPMLFVLWARNYASYECGSKVIAANSEAEGTPRILNEMMDEYLLNPCKAQIWFIVELCESIQPLGFELANYELFSSTPKDFTVYGSENYPTREWINLGSFTAQDVRTIQRFELQSQSRFFKYMKVEMKSHYGAEHYCPLSVIRFFGTSMVEEFDAIENGGSVEKNLLYTEVDNLASYESSQSTVSPTSSQSHPANLIGTAREVVMNMVRKAAMALSKFPSQESENFNKSEPDPLTEQRTSDVLQLSLSSIKLMPWLDKILKNCNDCGSIFVETISSSSCSDSTPNQRLCDYIKVLLGIKTYAILCEEVNKEPMLRFRCPLQSYFINSTNPLFLNGVGPDEIQSSDNLVPSYLTNILSDPFSSSSQQSSENNSQSKVVLDQPSTQQQPFIVETVSPSSVIEGSLLSSITSVPFEPNYNESENLKPSELITDLVNNNNTTNTPSFDHETDKLAGQSIDSSSSSSTDTNREKTLEETPTLSSSSSSYQTSSTLQPSTASQQPPQPLNHQAQPNQAQQQQQASSSPGATQPIAPTNTANWVPLSASQAKESVFIRMSNKIKALEVNLTLSNQILEDLSQKYKKNLEEMQRIMDETINKLNETATMAIEKDNKKQELIDDLINRLSLAEDQLSLFIAEKENMHWSLIGIHIVLLVVEIIIIFSIVSIYLKRASARLSNQYRDHVNSFQTKYQNGLRNHNSSSISLKRPKLSPYVFKPSAAKSKRIEGSFKRQYISFYIHSSKLHHEIDPTILKLKSQQNNNQANKETDENTPPPSPNNLKLNFPKSNCCYCLISSSITNK
ncbi:SUN domain-containing ossification factor-like [Panonychus citri]|uniref:SUN domain-containing ossification factor-like n=1 Tax=Panonychus citri TaxID=50023 RepID=UPI0023077B64|nr:SUN domain-containing ossification factor-like [Panonychus citri]